VFQLLQALRTLMVLRLPSSVRLSVSLQHTEPVTSSGMVRVDRPGVKKLTCCQAVGQIRLQYPWQRISNHMEFQEIIFFNILAQLLHRFKYDKGLLSTKNYYSLCR